MRSSIRLNQPVWVLMLAVVLVAVAGLALLLLSRTSSATQGPMLQAQIQQQVQAMSITLDEAIRQVQIALQQTNLAGQAPNLAGLQMYTHQVLNVMEGKQGPDYSMPAGDPGNGHGVQAYLQELLNTAGGPIAVAMSAMKLLGMPVTTQNQLVQALQSAQTASQGAVAYLKEALQAPSLNAAQGPLKAAVAALNQVQGAPSSASPGSGGLAYAKTIVAQMVNMMLQGGK